MEGDMIFKKKNIQPENAFKKTVKKFQGYMQDFGKYVPKEKVAIIAIPIVENINLLDHQIKENHTQNRSRNLKGDMR